MIKQRGFRKFLSLTHEYFLGIASLFKYMLVVVAVFISGIMASATLSLYIHPVLQFILVVIQFPIYFLLVSAAFAIVEMLED